MTAKTMKWARLGDYIRELDERNGGGEVSDYKGVNKLKEFIPTVADTNNLDNRNYKLVEQGVFVFSGMQTGRDICIRIAYKGDAGRVLVSPAYTTFKIKPSVDLLPEYLYMQFTRGEMDRLGWFLSDGSIRSNLDWDRFCDIRIPLPSLAIQRELVATYTGLKELAESNEALIGPLTEACQAFIIDCKRKWPAVPLGEYITQRREKSQDPHLLIKGVSAEGFISPKQRDADTSIYNVFYRNDFVFNPARMELNSIALNVEYEVAMCSSLYEVFYVHRINDLVPEYLSLFLKRDSFARYCSYQAMGSARNYFRVPDLSEVQIPLPPLEVQRSIVRVYECLEESRRIAREAREAMSELVPALVQRAIHS